MSLDLHFYLVLHLCYEKKYMIACVNIYSYYIMSQAEINNICYLFTPTNYYICHRNIDR